MRSFSGRSPATRWAFGVSPLALAVAVASGGSGLAFNGGSPTTWQVQTGSWFTGTNWTAGVPTSGGDASVSNGGTAQVMSGTAAADQLTIGGSSTVAVISGAALSVSGMSGAGMLTLDGGILQAAPNQAVQAGTAIAIGPNGGTINSNGGLLSVTGTLSGSTGTLAFEGFDGNPNANFDTVLYGASSFSGAITILAGTQVVSAHQNGLGSGALNVDGVFAMGNADQGVTTLTGGGNIYANGYLGPGQSLDTLTVQSGNFSGILGDGYSTNGPSTYRGTLRLVKTTGGTLVLSSVDSYYSGGTDIQGGTIQAASDNALGTGAVTLNGGTLQSGVAVGTSLTLANAIVIGPNGGIIDSNGAHTLDLTGGITGAGTPGGLTLVNSNFVTATNIDVILSGANTSTGGLTIQGNMQAVVNASNAAGLGSLTLSGTGALLAIGGSYSQSVTTLSGNGSIFANGFLSPTGSGVGTLSVGSGAFAGNLGNGHSNSGASTYTGVLDLVKTSAGLLTLSGTSTYSGSTLVAGGTLQAGSATAFSTRSAYTVNAGATLDLGGFSNGVDALSGAGLVTNAGTPAATLTVGAGNASNYAFSGTLADGAGTLGLIKRGSGTLTLTGANTFTGTTDVRFGTLSLLDGGSVGGPIMIESGPSGIATLDIRSSTPGRTQTLANAVSGGGDLTVEDTIVTATGDNSGFSGLVKIAGSAPNSGGFVVQGPTALGAGQASVEVDGNGVLNLGGRTVQLAALTDGTGSGLGAGTVLLGGGQLNVGGSGSSVAGFAGTIADGSAPGSLAKNGTGTLTLTGTNSYSGGTFLDGGTLALGNAAALGSGALTMASGTTLAAVADLTVPNAIAFASAGDPTIDTGANTVVLSGAISGPGNLTKIGTGTLDLTGADTYTGVTDVAQGTLLVDGSTASSAVSVESGTILGGRGTIGSLNLLSGATLAPGAAAPFSTLTVVGNATLQPGSTYVVDIAPGGQNDRLAVGGTAAVSGATLTVNALGTGFNPNTRYTFLTAAGGVTGQFGTLVANTSNLAFLSPAISYAPGSAVLTLTQAAPLASAAATPNQRAVATAIDSLGPGNPLYDAVVGLNGAGARQAFQATAGETHASATTTSVQSTRVVSSIVFDRLWNLPIPQAGDALDALKQFEPHNLPAMLQCYAPVTAPATGMRSSPGYTVWGQAIGDFGHTAGDGNAGAIDRTLGGFVLGIDSRIDAKALQNWRVGVAGGYTNTQFSVQSGAGSGTFENAFGTLYAGARYGNVTLRFGGTYGGTQTNASRAVAFPGFFETERSNNGGDTTQAFGEIGYRISTSTAVVEPVFNGAFTHTHQDAYREKGGAAALVGAAQDVDVGSTVLGFRSEVLPFGTLPVVARLFLGWQHTYGDINPAATLAFAAGGASFSSYGAPLDRNAVVAEAGLDWRVTTAMSLGLTYFGQAGERNLDNAVKGRVEYRF